MQINRTGVGLIAFFALVGLAIALAPLFFSIPAAGAATMVVLGGIWALTALGLGLFARRQKRKAAHQDWIFQNGIRGTATVVEVKSSGTINEMPLLRLVLDLDVPGLERRQVKRRELMSVFAARRIEPGLTLPVCVNPRDRDDLVLVW